MATVNERAKRTVLVIDDEPSVRESFSAIVDEAEFRAKSEPGPIHSAAEILRSARNLHAAVCDHHLKQRHNYATINGAEIAAAFYKEHKPAVLCTRWQHATPDEIRVLRRYLPVLVSPDEFNPDSLLDGFQQCLDEFGGAFRESREPVRTQVRIEEVSNDKVYVVVPAFSNSEVVGLPIKSVPKRARANKRVHAHVNVGAHAAEQLYFFDWEDS